MESSKLGSSELGNSLSKDAWRKLRRNRAAMLSMSWLILVCLLALITPILPLQPPDAEKIALQYTEPTASPVWLHNFDLDTETIASTGPAVEELEQELAELQEKARQDKQQLSDARHALPAGISDEDATIKLQPLEEQYEAAYEQARRKYTQIQDTIQLPYRKLGFAELGGISRSLVRARYSLFGDRNLNSMCGRDELGRDVLSRVFWGARVSLIVGLVATLVSLLIGVTYGAVAGYFGGWLDDAMMRLVDVAYSVPFIFVVIFIITILGKEGEPSIARELAYWGIGRITVFFVVIGAIYWLTMSRVVRGQVISLKNEPFVEAAQS